MKLRPTIFACALFVATPVLAQQNLTAFTQAPAYKECAALAGSNPIEAERKALQWLQIDDGVGPHHCMAMALYGQRRFVEAADRLGVVRGKIPAEQVALRSYVTRQASKAWVDAGRLDMAIDTLGSQINDMGSLRGNNATSASMTSELLLDRARLRITYGQLAPAVQDLDHAVSLTPANEDVLVERALAFEALGDTPLAKQDIATVLKLNPANGKARDISKRLENPAAPPKAL